MDAVKAWIKQDGFPFAGGFLTCVVLVLWGGIALLVAPRAEASPHTVAAEFDLEIVWLEDVTTVCGDMAAGCFLPDTPDVIYVGSRLTPEYTKHAVLHEIGHAVQHRLGLPFDECKADDFAQALGSTSHSYDCPAEG